MSWFVVKVGSPELLREPNPEPQKRTIEIEVKVPLIYIWLKLQNAQILGWRPLN